MSLLPLMRAIAKVGLGVVAVEAKHLQGRVIRPTQHTEPLIETLPAHSARAKQLLTMITAVVIHMIQRQKSKLCLATARAYTAVVIHSFPLDLLIVLSGVRSDVLRVSPARGTVACHNLGSGLFGQSAPTMISICTAIRAKLLSWIVLMTSAAATHALGHGLLPPFSGMHPLHLRALLAVTAARQCGAKLTGIAHALRCGPFSILAGLLTTTLAHGKSGQPLSPATTGAWLLVHSVTSYLHYITDWQLCIRGHA